MPNPPPPSNAVAVAKYGERYNANIQGQSVDVPYLVKGAASRDEAIAAICAVAPATVPGHCFVTGGIVPVLVLLALDADEEASPEGLWEGSARYGTPTMTPRRSTGEWAFQFETGGGTQHITNALQHILSKPCPGTATAPDHGGAINVNGDGDVGGCDVISPTFRFTVTGYFAPSAVNQAMLNALYQLTGKANSVATTVTVNGVALNFAAGELLYEGASGGMRGYTDWEITFRLAASPNSTDVCANWPASVKPTAAVPKKGWEYAWIEYQTQWDANAHTMARKPIAVHVEQVYLTADFTALNIP